MLAPRLLVCAFARAAHLNKIGEAMLHSEVVLSNGRFDDVLGVASDVRVPRNSNRHGAGRCHESEGNAGRPRVLSAVGLAARHAEPSRSRRHGRPTATALYDQRCQSTFRVLPPPAGFGLRVFRQTDLASNGPPTLITTTQALGPPPGRRAERSRRATVEASRCCRLLAIKV